MTQADLDVRQAVGTLRAPPVRRAPGGPARRQPELEARAVLGSFGIGACRLRREPSLSSAVHRVQAGKRVFFLKRHAGEAAARLRWEAQFGERLLACGIRAPRLLPAEDGELSVRRGGALYTLMDDVGGTPLTRLRPGEARGARLLGELLARIHGALDPPPAAAVVPSIAPPWRDEELEARAVGARAGLLTLRPGRSRRSMLTALDYVENVAAEQLAEGPPARVGVVHGDYWPGNLLARASDLSDVGVVDVEHSCRAPLLVDVAHFADLAFRRGARTDRLELDLRLATAFAQAWADASGYPREELAALPRALVTARATCLLWIIERHVDRGPGPLDRVVSDDLRAIAFVRRSAARWSERLAGSGR